MYRRVSQFIFLASLCYCVGVMAEVAVYYFGPMLCLPRISCESPQIDLGVVDKTKEMVECDFAVRNIGREVLHIRSVSPSCGSCITVLGKASCVVEPDQVQVIRLRLDLTDTHGKFSKDVLISCDDPVRPKMRLHVIGCVAEE